MILHTVCSKTTHRTVRPLPCNYCLRVTSFVCWCLHCYFALACTEEDKIAMEFLGENKHYRAKFPSKSCSRSALKQLMKWQALPLCHRCPTWVTIRLQRILPPKMPFLLVKNADFIINFVNYRFLPFFVIGIWLYEDCYCNIFTELYCSQFVADSVDCGVTGYCNEHFCQKHTVTYLLIHVNDMNIKYSQKL